MKEYAIIKTGSKQYRVEQGDVIDVELLGENIDGKVEINDVIFFHNGKDSKVGSPLVAGAVVRAEILNQVRGPKVISYKYKKRKNYRKKIGHRQNYSRIKIVELSA